MRITALADGASEILARVHSNGHGLNLGMCSGNIVLLFLQRMLENYFVAEKKKRLPENL